MAVKKWVFKLNFLILGCFTVAASADVPYVFESGRPALASEVNANFKAIDTTPPTLVATTTIRDDLLYIHNVTISDDTELEKFVSHYSDFVKIPGPSNTYDGSVLAAPMSGKNLEATIYQNKEFSLGSRVKEITFEVLVTPFFSSSTWTIADGPESYYSYFTATDTSGNTGKLMLSAPFLDGLLNNSIRPGWYQLDSAITTTGPCNSDTQQAYEYVYVSTSYGVNFETHGSNSHVSSVSGSDGSSSSETESTRKALEGVLFSCPTVTAFDDSDPSYSSAPRSKVEIYANAYPTKSTGSSAIPRIYFSSTYSENVFQNAFCAPAIVGTISTNQSNQVTGFAKNGGTITSNGDGSVTFNFETACATDGSAQTVTYSATGRWVNN